MTAFRRLPDWRPRLFAAIEARRRVRVDDCALFVADCIMAMTGHDLAATYRGRYGTLAQGVELLRADGHEDLCAFAAAHLPEVAPAFACAGDVMAFDASALPGSVTGWALGIVNGERVTVARGDGLGTLGRERAARAFRVP